MARFPTTVLEFQRLFPDDDACWQYLVATRWPDGNIVCPDCGEKALYFIENDRLWECPNRHHFSVTNGTVMHRSHVSLLKWFWAAYLVTTQTPGISAMVLHRQLGVCYETAYMILQRLRASMVNPERGRLSGVVEVDEGYVSAGHVREARTGRGSGKPIVVAAVEVRGRAAGRVRLRLVEDVSAKTLIGFVRAYVEEGSTVRTDGWAAYASLSRTGYRHVVVEGEDAIEVAENLPHIHRAFSNLKAWLIGTHHGVSSKHLQAYLNEFVFRYNRRGNPQAAFLAVLQIATEVEGPEYAELYAAGEEGGWVHRNPRSGR